MHRYWYQSELPSPTPTGAELLAARISTGQHDNMTPVLANLHLMPVYIHIELKKKKVIDHFFPLNQHYIKYVLTPYVPGRF